LVRIETDHRNPNERQPGTLSRREYTQIEALEVEDEDSEPVTHYEASKTAIVVYGEGAGNVRTVYTDPECPVHHPSRVAPIDPNAEARRKQHEKEQARRRRLEKGRAETFRRILENVPASFTAPQLRVLLRAFITCDLYGQSDVVATHYAGEDDDNQSSEEILLSVADRLEEVQLPGFRLALPTGAYYTWRGTALEGSPIEPDVISEFDWRDRRHGNDRQFDTALKTVSAELQL
jgi:ParB family chromosome partitioning protein